MFKKFIVKLIYWVLVTAAFYGAAYVFWAFSPLISVGLALAHGYWHARITAIPGSQAGPVRTDDPTSEGIDLFPGPSIDMGSVQYRQYRDYHDSLSG